MTKETYRFRFKGMTKGISKKGHVLFEDIYNLDENRPFRYHCWVEGKTKHYKNPVCLEFFATLYLYRKYNGNYRLGLKDLKVIKECTE